MATTSNASSTIFTPAEVLADNQFGLLSAAPLDHHSNDPLAMEPLLEDDSTWMMMNLNSTPVRHLSLDRGRPVQEVPHPHRRYTMPADLTNLFEDDIAASLPTTEMAALTLPSCYPPMFVDALPSPPFLDASGQSSLYSSLASSLQPSLQSSKASSLASSPKTASTASSVKPSGRRKSSHSSVAAAVALTVHEPTTHFINGIEHLTFMYSHDRHIKQYTIRTDIDDVDLNDIDEEFRQASAVS